MTRFTKILMGATALSMTAGVAMAQTTGTNKSYTDQQGQNNSVTVWQDQTTGSEIGTPSNAALQNGSFNTLVIDQDGSSQKVGAAGGDFLQEGFRNVADILQQGSGNNTLNVLQQSVVDGPNPPRNELYVDQLGTNNLISSVSQKNEDTSNDADGNIATITQQTSANANIVESVTQVGGSNDLAITQGGGFRNVAGNIDQTYLGGGVGNSIQLTMIGDYNGDIANTGALSIDGWNATGNGNDIKQTGNDNTLVASFSGTANRFDINQFGGQGNSATVDVLGNWNEVGIMQVDSENTAFVNINGNFNELGIYQDGVAGVDFGNLVTATINSSNNAAVVVQNGGNNTASINQ